MKTKHFLLSALAVIIITAASVSNLFTSERPTTLKCYEDLSYSCPDDTTKPDDEDGNGGGTIIFPGGN